MASLSNRQVSIPPADYTDVFFKGSAQGDTAIHFELFMKSEYLNEKTVSFL